MMKTKCYCIFCPKHPLHEKRHDLAYPRGWEPRKIVFGEEEKSGKEVDCLKPGSDAFMELSIEVDEFEYPVTAYGDGCSETGFIGDGFTVFATCMNEEYKE